jgi:AcrR family transcriptional regulator
MVAAPRFRGGSPIVRSKHAYYDAAMELLAVEGAHAVSVTGLCAALGASTGSFYHHFAGWDDFLEKFLVHWERQQTTRVIELALRHEDARERFLVLGELATAVPHAPEAAIRAWAYHDEVVAAAQERVDGERLAFAEEVVYGLVHDRPLARALAVHLVATFVGLQGLRPALAPAEVAAVLEIFQRHVLAEAARPRIDR